MWRLWILLSLSFLSCNPIAYANETPYEMDLSFDQTKYDSLKFEHKELYKLITLGVKAVPLGSSREQIQAQMGTPIYSTTTDPKEVLTYYDRCQFRVVTFFLKKNKLTAILLIEPVGPLSHITYSDISYFNGKLIFGFQHSTNSYFNREVYIDFHLHRSVNIGWSPYIIGWSPYINKRTASLKRFHIGYISTKDLFCNEVKSLLGYAGHAVMYAFKHHELPKPKSD